MSLGIRDGYIQVSSSAGAGSRELGPEGSISVSGSAVGDPIGRIGNRKMRERIME